MTPVLTIQTPEVAPRQPLRVGSILWRNRYLFAASAVVGVVVAAIVTLFLPKSFVAETTLLPMAKDGGSPALSALLAPQMGANLGLMAGLQGGKSADLVEVLKSRTMIRRVITSCGLEKQFPWKVRSDLDRRLGGMTVIKPPSLTSKVVVIKVASRNPEQAATIANSYVTNLKRMLDDIGYNQAARERKFVEAQLSRNKEQLTRAEERLSVFQAKHNIPSLPESVASAVKSIAELEGRNLAASAELQGVEESLVTMKEKVQSLEAAPEQVSALEIRRRALKAQQGTLLKAEADYQRKLQTLPPVAIDFVRLQREVQVLNAVVMALSEQREGAVLKENRETDAFIILDEAVVPDRKALPRPKVNMAIGFLAGLLLCATFVFYREVRESVK